ncbi:MAG: ComEA family DNA-binding protein [Candidatus Cloacimonetes bacterium]|jgi:competence protein ComEA|nr:ComEA family DNA-binding protein [Candidatus Cloacimonadota bacterium]MDY0336385.1 ComEA family DNA-binding protein [Candidatus Cloacimonadaceae bacterium]MCB5269666.1 ComEA family DNA-binding protein [Candidatus Cloacimonadota bacterium]MCK9333816.1 ComEA family DNA-binding protein [Candidatus Cloacimonadota bacterium]MDD2543236.1 ComEA family DNA-binding protein [Candidatus Cloacimonadota bacterium]
MKLSLNNLFSQGEQKILLFLAFFLLLGIGLRLSGGEQLPAQAADSLSIALKDDYKLMIDIRTATLAELMTLSGIGEKRAEDILEYRDRQAFVNVVDLIKVPGIGPKTYQKNLPNLLIFGDSLLPVATQAGKSTPAKQEMSFVNINTAGLEELCCLKGIGEVKARAIITYREEHGPFQDVQELTNVKGIGPATLQKNLSRIKL